MKVSPLQDHPRVCGEKYIKNFMGYSTLGSPPRMRGKGASSRRIRAEAGITPAYAGKRKSRIPIFPDTEDHPRVCGEKAVQPYLQAAMEGSPPRMRGKVCRRHY